MVTSVPSSTPFPNAISGPTQWAALDANQRHDFDVILVGAGIVGSALSYSLAKSGRKVAMVERDLTEPDRIVGELLQPGGVRALGLLGIKDALDGIDAVPVEGYQVFYRGRSVPIPYPDEKVEDQARGVESSSGRVEGRSFHHGKFVQSLRRKAVNQPGVTTFEATVRDLVQDKDGKIQGISATWKTESAEGLEQQSQAFRLQAPLTIVADGCFSKFRRSHGSSIAPTVRSNFVGLELTHAPLPSPRHGHVVLGGAGPVLLYQIGSSTTRILIDVPGEKLPSSSKGLLQAHIYEKVIPQLPEVLQPCLKQEMDKGQRLRSMPNSFLPPSMQGQSNERKGVIVVGDAMNMRHPLTGGGMSVGLWDCIHLTQALGGGKWYPLPTTAEADVVDLQDWEAIRPALKSWHWSRKGLSSVINILAQALYSLFGADDENLEVLREGCFKYFELGGECVNGPVSLLSGLAPRPMLLVYHFFAVAVYSIMTLFTHPRRFKGEGSTERRPTLTDYPALLLRSVLVFYTACVVLLPVVLTELRSNIPKFSNSATASTASTASSSSSISPPLTSRKNRKGQGSNSEASGTTMKMGALLVALAAALLYTGHGRAAGLTGGMGANTNTITDWFFFPKAAAAGL
ncbi:SE-domain-containing protein [Violaceomyces palustris]|uniref:SE-domain-containing protein n=1 Tax=Violaceomyces palustris TaxID=1673888 RepID=A0ACD0NXY7_9BASI|nr:SE-domain-containing protein [Violaceomyces palustris]